MAQAFASATKSLKFWLVVLFFGLPLVAMPLLEATGEESAFKPLGIQRNAQTDKGRTPVPMDATTDGTEVLVNHRGDLDGQPLEEVQRVLESLASDHAETIPLLISEMPESPILQDPLLHANLNNIIAKHGGFKTGEIIDENELIVT